MVKLKEITEVITKGTTPTTLGYSFTNFGVRFIKIENITVDNKIIAGDDYISDECNEKLKRSQLKNGDILFSIAGAIGRCAIVDDSILPANTNQALAIIRLKKDVGVDRNYLIKFLQSDKVVKQYSKMKQGVAQINLSLTNIGDFEIYLTPLPTQCRIAAELDAVCSVLAKQKQQYELLGGLVKSKFNEMFGDPVKNDKEWTIGSLADVCSSIVRGPFGSALKKEFFVEKSATTYKVYEQKNAIQKNAEIGSYHITQEKFKELKRFECISGDFIMSCSGTIGEIFQLPIGCERGVINQALCKFTLNDKTFPSFFLMIMKLSIENLETKGSGLQNIGAVSFVRAMPFILPPTELQHQFADFVTQTEQAKLKLKAEMEQTETLYKALMQKYFKNGGENER